MIRRDLTWIPEMKAMHSAILLGLSFATAFVCHSQAYRNPYGKLPAKPTAGDRSLQSYFRSETEALERRSLAGFETLEQWTSARASLRRELFEMLALDPEPPRTDLKATVTGMIDGVDFTVEKLHFQSRPGLYVTANVYVPKNLAAPAPAVLYLCGHGPVKTNGVSYGNKVTYQHHGIWFARNGYVCLVIDTVQLGEIEGVHHGTHREGMWWWNSRGYTSAGVEAWNGIRALDYLQSRGDVDGTRLGVTGRSGGGAYSWWVAALDERVRAVAPVAGITDLRNHVVDGAVEGHCDCMFMVNTYRWDFAQLAALVAPRPLLICNTDKDTIFPLDGVIRVFVKTRGIYDLYNVPEKLGLVVTEGPHKDTQELQLPVMRWFNKWLKNSSEPVESAAARLFSPSQLKVFATLPSDEKTSRCFEDFTTLASDDRPLENAQTISALRRKTFGGWPEDGGELAVREVSTLEKDGVRLTAYVFESQPGVSLKCYVVRDPAAAPKAIRFACLDPARWRDFLKLAREPFGSALEPEISTLDLESKKAAGFYDPGASAQWLRRLRDSGEVFVAFAPRTVGATAISGDPRHVTHLRRRFMLLGQTLAGMQAWDVRRAVQSVRRLSGMESLPLHLRASPETTEVAVFAALFEPGISELTLSHPPRDDKEAPDFLNWRRIVTPGQLLKAVESRCRVQFAAEEFKP